MEDNLKNFKISTPYNSIQVVNHQGKLELRSRDKSLQSAINLQHPHRLELRNLEYLMSVLLFIKSPRRILMLGTAAGSLLHFLRHHYALAEITALDIDSALIDKLLHLGILPAADNRLGYVCADAADYIQQAEQHYDLVLVDVFHGAQSPAWLLTKTTVKRLHDLLSDQGALALNLLVDSDHDFKRFYQDLRQQFQQQALSLPVPDFENKVVYGVRGKLEPRDMATNLHTAMELSAQLDIEFMPILSLIYNTNPAASGLL